MMETVRTERQKQRKRTLAAVLASLFIHLLIVLAAFVILSMKPKWIAKLAPKTDLAPAEFTLIPPPSEPPKKKERDFFDSSQGQVSKKAPDKAAFESDQNTVAASELPAQSNEPVPTQEGDKAPGLTLVAKNLSLGPAREPAPPSPKAAAQQAQETPEKPREQKEKPVEKTKEVAEAKPTPKPTPRSTPKPAEDELALLEPVKPREQKPKPEVRRPEPPSRPSVPRQPGFQPQTRITRLSGGISNRGRSSVDSVGTPLGRYKKALSDAIGSRWYYYVNDMLDLVGIGTVQLQFVVRADGKVESVKVLRNTSNESLASCSVRSIIEAEIPPIPKDIAGSLAGGRLEVDYSFTIIGQ